MRALTAVFFWHHFPGFRLALLANIMELSSQPVIFVVEDNLMYQNLIAKELESLSQNIHFYTTGESCLDDLDLCPSVIVLDYNLDGEMNGLDTLQKVRDKNPDVYVILFSSQKGLNTKEILLQYGSFDFLEKNSLSLRTLRQMVCCVTSPGGKAEEN
jgi:two-component system OmpR family response regulator